GRGSVAFCYETTTLTTPVGVDIYNTALTGNITCGARTLPISILLPLPASEGNSPTGVATKYTITYNFTKPTDFLSSSAFVTYPGVATGSCSKLISTKLSTKAPLVISSHRQPGKKELLSAHAELLASKGYGDCRRHRPHLLPLDHKNDTLAGAYDQASMTSSLLNRRQDQLFIYDQIAALTTTVPATTSKLAYLYNNVDATKTSIVGYSFGGSTPNKQYHYSAVGFTGVLGLFKGITNSVGRMLVTLKSVGHQIANNPAPADWLDSTDDAGWMHLNDQDQVIKNGTTTTSTNSYFQVTPASGPDASGKITPKSIPGFSWRTVDGISIEFS
ncbi:hypothetical protein HDU76_001535, partial [Blyttiomyces sp. JEL0837]